MKIFIRCDSSFALGTGHVVRCLNLAYHLKNKGLSPTFICRELVGNVIDLIEEKQFKVVRLPEVGELEEISHYSALLTESAKTLIIVDNYSISSAWERTIAGLGVFVFTVDDLGRDHACIALLDQNFQPAIHDRYRNIPNCTLFLGPEYVLLGAEFSNGKTPRVIKEKVENILVFFGGTDPARLTLPTLSWLHEAELGAQLIVVVGEKNPELIRIEEYCGKNKFELHVQTKRMDELMAKADLFVGAGGSVTWERCSLGLPALCVAIADNQVPMSEALALKGVHAYLGSAETINEKQVVKGVKEIMLNKKLREEYSQQSIQLGVGSKTSVLVDYLVTKIL